MAPFARALSAALGTVRFRQAQLVRLVWFAAFIWRHLCAYPAPLWRPIAVCGTNPRTNRRQSLRAVLALSRVAPGGRPVNSVFCLPYST